MADSALLVDAIRSLHLKHGVPAVVDVDGEPVTISIGTSTERIPDDEGPSDLDGWFIPPNFSDGIRCEVRMGNDLPSDIPPISDEDHEGLS